MFIVPNKPPCIFKLVYLPSDPDTQMILITLLNRQAIFNDFYYFMLDESEKYKSLEGMQKVYTICLDLFQSWITSIREARTFLPFDLSDQYVGAFKVERMEDDEVELTYGFFRDLHGYEVTMEDLLAQDLSNYTFQISKHFSTVLLPLTQLIDSIKEGLISVTEKHLEKHD